MASPYAGVAHRQAAMTAAAGKHHEFAIYVSRLFSVPRSLEMGCPSNASFLAALRILLAKRTMSNGNGTSLQGDPTRASTSVRSTTATVLIARIDLRFFDSPLTAGSLAGGGHPVLLATFRRKNDVSGG